MRGKNTVELIPGGAKVRVDDDNKFEFIKKKCHFIAYKQIQSQLDHIIQGFQSVISLDWISVFTTEELELAISGQ